MISKLLIFNVYLNTVEKEIEVLSHNPYISINHGTATDLFDPSFTTPSLFDLLMKGSYLKNFIFIFHNMSWHLIQALFRKHHILVSGGSSTKRHILSPTEFRLAIFIGWIFESSKSSVAKSFHHENLFINNNSIKPDGNINVNTKEILDKIYLFNRKTPKEENTFKNETNQIINTPNINNLTKKEYHTTSRCYNSNKELTIIPEPLINTKFSGNIINSFLGEIESINQNKSISPLEAQIIIENKWLDLIEEKYEDMDYLNKTYSNGFIQKLSYAKRTLDALYKSGRLKYHFPTIYPFLNDTKLLILTYGIAVNSIIMNIGYTNISSILGRKIIAYIYVQSLKRKSDFIS